MAEINQLNKILSVFKLPELTISQWDELCSTTEGTNIRNAIDNQHPLHYEYLELIIRCFSPYVESVLLDQGIQISLEELITYALTLKRPLFLALHSVHANNKNAAQANEYLKANIHATRIKKTPIAPPYYSFHVYGTKSALCFSEATALKNFATINIEGANALAKGYNWNNKIIVQLIQAELFLFLALLQGKIKKINLPGRGENRDKLLEIERQETVYFCKLVQKGRPPVAVPITGTSAIDLMLLVMKQIKKNHPNLQDNQMDQLVEQYLRMQPNLNTL